MTIRHTLNTLGRLVATLTLSAATLAVAHAADFKAGSLEINDLWVRGSVPGQTNGAGYMQINNPSGVSDRLLSAQSEASTRLELHTVLTENGVAKMRQVQGIDIPAKGSAKLAPGGFHLMFLQLTGPFKQGDSVPVVLKFEKAGEVRVNFTVKPSTFNPGSAGEQGHSGMKH
ncbi:MAG: copper chaperone PCu(A)C [Candidatus Methylopumilus sp.]|nr:copper chaperone PCu(A)C [Candidatus Methylopumilus sp.]